MNKHTNQEFSAERVAKCLSACEGMLNPEAEIAALRECEKALENINELTDDWDNLGAAQMLATVALQQLQKARGK